MFKELYALTESAPVMLLLSREGERLRVNLTRKRDEDEKTVPLSLSIFATPDELDRELPLALAEGLAIREEASKAPSVADQVKGQIEAAAPTKKKKAARAARKASAKARPAAAPRKPARAPAKAKPAAAPRKPPRAPATTRAAKPTKGTPLKPSPALAAVAGPGPFLHNDAMKALWVYIKAHDLQGPKNKRRITCDATLEALIGKSVVDVKELAAIVRRNLGEPVAGAPAPKDVADAAPPAPETPAPTPQQASQAPAAASPTPEAPKPPKAAAASDPDSLDLF